MNDRKQHPLKKDTPGIMRSPPAIGSSKTGKAVPDPLLLELKYLSTLHENILLKMLYSKWLQAFKLTSKGKWRLEWSTRGARRMARLREIIKRYHLTRNDLFPIGFTLLARDAKMAAQVPSLPATVLAFWRNCCNEIDLANSLEAGAIFVQILTSDDGRNGE
jgi:hypothetical protein